MIQEANSIKIINSLTELAKVVLLIATAIISFLSLRKSSKNSTALHEVNEKVDGVLTANTEIATAATLLAGRAQGVEEGRQLEQNERREVGQVRPGEIQKIEITQPVKIEGKL